ncbi:Protein PRRC2C [Chelonia mydas]|uniref:Protein PRRC2C n=1 Tax=Chelonia mydas TaxID=8469 RepID=M7BFZ7_CHEMY|nr:Protein PRRC2C [Chelonia mydas]
MASVMSMRRASLLLLSGLSREAQNSLQDFPFDGKALFAEQTDMKLHGLKDSRMFKILGLYIPAPARTKFKLQQAPTQAIHSKYEPPYKKSKDYKKRPQRQSRSAPQPGPSNGKQMSEMDLKAFGSGIDVKPGTPPVTGRSTTPTSSPFRAASASPNNQSNKMNSIVYQKQFQSAAAAVRMTQPFPAQFAPQILSQPNLIPPLVRAPHTNTFPAPVQRPPMALASQMPPQLTTGLMSHPRLQHVARGPCVSLSGVRGNQAQATMKAEQDVKAKQRAEVLQSTHRFFSEQQQPSKPIGGKAQKVDESGSKPAEAMTDSSGVCQDKMEEKPAPAPAVTTKPVRTGPIKPQAIKTEETKS